MREREAENQKSLNPADDYDNALFTLGIINSTKLAVGLSKWRTQLGQKIPTGRRRTSWLFYNRG